MPVNLSIKHVPDALADALRRRAERNHRSMQGEMMAILEGVLLAPQSDPAAPDEPDRRHGVRTAEDALTRMREESRGAP